METDFIELIETRRSIRSYKKEPVSVNCTPNPGQQEEGYFS